MKINDSAEVETGVHEGHTATVVGIVKVASLEPAIAKVTCSCGDVLTFSPDGELSDAMSSLVSR